jgi:hypothetical protein
MPVPNREILRPGKCAHRELADDCAPLDHLGEKLLVLFGVDDLDPAAEDSYGRAGRRHRSPGMRARIDSPREATHDYHTSIRQIAPQLQGHLIPIRRRTTRANHRDLMTVEKCPVSNEIEKRWRVVDLEEALRVVRLIRREERHSGGLGLGQLFGGGTEGVGYGWLGRRRRGGGGPRAP